MVESLIDEGVLMWYPDAGSNMNLFICCFVVIGTLCHFLKSFHFLFHHLHPSEELVLVLPDGRVIYGTV